MAGAAAKNAASLGAFFPQRLEEENSGEDSAFSELNKVNKACVTARLKEIKGDEEAKDEAAVLNEWLKLADGEANLKNRLKDAESALDARACAQYPKLMEEDIQRWSWTTNGWLHSTPPFMARWTASARPSLSA